MMRKQPAYSVLMTTHIADFAAAALCIVKKKKITLKSQMLYCYSTGDVSVENYEEVLL